MRYFDGLAAVVSQQHAGETPHYQEVKGLNFFLSFSTSINPCPCIVCPYTMLLECDSTDFPKSFGNKEECPSHTQKTTWKVTHIS